MTRDTLIICSIMSSDYADSRLFAVSIIFPLPPLLGVSRLLRLRPSCTLMLSGPPGDVVTARGEPSIPSICQLCPLFNSLERNRDGNERTCPYWQHVRMAIHGPTASVVVVELVASYFQLRLARRRCVGVSRNTYRNNRPPRRPALVGYAA